MSARTSATRFKWPLGASLCLCLAGAAYFLFVPSSNVPLATKLERWIEAAQESLPGAGPNPVVVVEAGQDYQVIRHAGGTTRIPFPPRRICALSSADELLSIGVTPVAHSIKDGNYPDYLDALKEIPWIPNVYGDAMPNLEAIIAVQPDLIITRAPDRQTYLQLSKIAPVVVLLGHQNFYRERVLDVGTIVGRRAAARARVAWYDAKVAAARAALHAVLKGRTVAFFRVHPRTFQLSGSNDSGGQVINGDLGLLRPQLVREHRRDLSVSPELLLDLDADYAIIAIDISVGSVRHAGELLEHPAWQRLPAARAGQTLLLSRYRHWADSGILGKGLIIDDVLRAIAPQSVPDVNAQSGAMRDGSDS